MDNESEKYERRLRELQSQIEAGNLERIKDLERKVATVEQNYVPREKLEEWFKDRDSLIRETREKLMVLLAKISVVTFVAAIAIEEIIRRIMK